MEQDGEIVSGEVEIDETYIGGRRKLSKKFDNKSIVFGAVERNGRVKSAMSRVLALISYYLKIQAGVAEDAQIYSDEWAHIKHLQAWLLAYDSKPLTP